MALTKARFRMIEGETFNVLDFGAIGNDTADDTTAIQAAIDAASAAGGGVVYFPVPSVGYRITSTINLPVRVQLRGASRRSVKVVVRAGSYPTGYAFLVNTTDGDDWVVPFPNLNTPTVADLDFETDDTSLFCFAFNGSFAINDCYFRFFAKSINGGPRYNDLVLIDNCHFTHTSVPATYQVELGNTGDAVVISRCHFPNVGNSPNTPLPSIKTNGTPVNVRDTLAGDIYLQTSTTMSTLDRVGGDGGSWDIIDSNVTINNAGLSALESDAVIRIDNSSGFAYSVEINNSTISHDVARGLYTPHEYDIAVDNLMNVTFNNVYKRTLNSTAPASRALQGVKIKALTGTPLPAFNKYSYMYSTRCVIRNQTIVGNPFALETPGVALNLLGPAFSYSSADWEGANGTYYYKAVLYYDTDRAVGRLDAASEISQAATTGGAAIGMEITEGAYPPCKIVRIYRGTSTGSYDAYADIPIINAPSLVDIGPHISGAPWVSRSAGPVDTINVVTLRGVKFETNRFTLLAPIAPTVGTWAVGDIIQHSVPAAGGNFGWVCTTAGTPGTWKTFGAISA